MEKQINQQNLTTTSNLLNNSPTNHTLIGSSQTHTQDVTRFTTSGEINTVRETHDRNARDHFKALSDTQQRTIQNFMARPYLVKTGTLPAVTGIITRVNVMEELKKMITKYKLSGFYAFKARARLQVVINAQPFHTGLLGLSYTPMWDQPNGDRHEAGFYVTFSEKDHEMRFMTGCPTTYVNIGSSNMMELSVPYVGDDGLCRVDDGDFGVFHFYSLIQLRDSTNAPTVHYNIYLSFEDLETYATYPSLTPQSSDVLKTLLQALQQATGNSEQSQTQEAEAKENDAPTGIVSGIASKVSSISKELTAVPGIADIAGPVSWVADGVGKVAKMFGFSRPHATESQQPVWINPYKNFNHADQNDHATKMSLNSKQEIQVRDIGIEGKDEMNLTHILSKPMYYSKMTWNASHEQGRELFYVPITPTIFEKETSWGSDVGNKLISPTFLSYLGQMFNFWTGTIRLTFVFAANKFYSGRLRYVYYVKDNPSKEYQHLYSHVVDIRDANIFTVDCPFIHTRPWRRTSGDSNCFLKVFVETPLAHPETVSSVMECAIFASAAKDFAFASPSRVRAMPCNGADLTKVASPLIPQGFTLNLNSEEVPANISMANEISQVDAEQAHKLAIGDPVVSLRQLSKKYMHNGFINWNTQMLLVRPFKPLSVQDNSHITPTQFQPADFIDWITALYRFRAGGVRIALEGMDGSLQVCHRSLKAIRYKDDHYKLVYLGGVDNRLSPGILGEIDIDGTLARAEQHHSAYYSMFPHNSELQGHLRFEVPYYSCSALTKNDRVRFNIDVGSDGRISLDQVNEVIDYGRYYDDTDNIVTIFRTNKDENFVTAYRAAADDFNCGFLVGPPPIRREKYQ